MGCERTVIGRKERVRVGFRARDLVLLVLVLLAWTSNGDG
jgi:hypothetical protein